jgi:predicted metal-dependent hydrolase
MDQTYPLHIKSHPRSKKMTLKIKHLDQRVILTKPHYISTKRAQKFYDENRDWVNKTINDYAEQKTSLTEIPIFGKSYKIILLENKSRTHLTQDKILLGCDEKDIKIRLKTYLKTILRSKLHETVRIHAEKEDLIWNVIRIKDTSSRWGSCSVQKNLNFSWRLVFLPEFVFDYIVAHEVAHLRHLHHRQEFWDLVKTLSPQTENAKKWLKENGTSVFQIPL